MIVFSIDLHPEDGYVQNEKVNAACVKRNREFFGNDYKIFTPEDKIVQEAYDFFGRDLVNNRPHKSFETDLIRVYILWKEESAWYIDADVFIQKKVDLSLLDKRYGNINSWGSFFSATNGGCEKGRKYWGEIAKKIKKDLIENGDSIEKFDGYYYRKFNMKVEVIPEILIYHFEKVCLFYKKDCFVYLPDELMKKRKIRRKDYLFISVNPDINETYSMPDEMPLFKEIWKDTKDFKEYVKNVPKQLSLKERKQEHLFMPILQKS